MPQRISALARVLNPLRLTRYARSSTPVDRETRAASDATEHHRFTKLLGFLRAGRRQLAVGAAVVAVGLVGLTALPALAAPAPSEQPLHLQAMSVSAPVVLPHTARDGYDISHFTPVMWPVPAGTRMSSDFGPRSCRGCSSFHRGVDWNPGAGYPIPAIADGVVTEAGTGGELGVHASIQHNINGEIVTSIYGHMQRGSMSLHVGDAVGRGQIIGLVGSTGMSTGAHLHFGLEHGANVFDPIPWMQAHVNS